MSFLQHTPPPPAETKSLTHTHTAEYLSGLDENRTTHSHADVHVLAAATEQSGLKDES